MGRAPIDLLSGGEPSTVLPSDESSNQRHRTATKAPLPNVTCTGQLELQTFAIVVNKAQSANCGHVENPTADSSAGHSSRFLSSGDLEGSSRLDHGRRSSWATAEPRDAQEAGALVRGRTGESPTLRSKRFSSASTAIGIQCSHRLSRAPRRPRLNRPGRPPHLERPGQIGDREESGEATVI